MLAIRLYGTRLSDHPGEQGSPEDRLAFEGVFSDDVVSFDHAEFSSEVSFRGVEFTGVLAHFIGAKFGGKVIFDDAEFTGGAVGFANAEFSGSEVSFTGAEFSSGRVSFANAKFFGSEVSFDSAKFSGREVDFSNVAVWSHPPIFNRDGEPPEGVLLPEEAGHFVS